MNGFFLLPHETSSEPSFRSLVSMGSLVSSHCLSAVLKLSPIGHQTDICFHCLFLEELCSVFFPTLFPLFMPIFSRRSQLRLREGDGKLKKRTQKNIRTLMNRLGTRPVGYGYKSNHPVACGAAGWFEKEYMEKE